MTYFLETRGYVSVENPEWGKTCFTTTFEAPQEALAAMKVATQDDNNVFARVYVKDDVSVIEWYYGGPDFDDL